MEHENSILKVTTLEPKVQTAELETFPNQYAGREYEIEIHCPEFTSVCPKTGQPDFGVLTFHYVPAATCVELKSLKLYLQAFRNQGIFYEHVVNMILDDFVAACNPIRATVTGEFTPRGGISSKIVARHAAGESSGSIAADRTR